MSSSLEEGAALGPWEVASVDAGKMKVLAEVLDDPNPIHLDPEAVKAMGLGDRVVNQGPANFGYIFNMLREAVPSAQVMRLSVRLGGNVFAGDALVAAGRVDERDDLPNGTLLTCSVWLDVKDGKRVLDGSAVLHLPAA